MFPSHDHPVSASFTPHPGDEFAIIQNGTGQITLTAGTGVTINKPADQTLKSRVQYSSLVCIYTGVTNVWNMVGDAELA